MEGWNGGRGSSWSGYRLDTVGSNASSSRSGTIVSGLSTVYSSSGSRFSSFSVEAAMHFESLGIHGDINGNHMDEPERIRSLVKDFFSAPANCIIKRGNVSVVERWLTELGVGWALSLDDDPSAEEEEELHRDARTWIQALHRMTQTIRSTRPLFPDRDFSLGLPSICVEQGEHVGGICTPDRYHFTLFIQETLLKMLTFVDLLVAWDPNTTQEFLTMDRVVQLSFNNLSILLGVHKALSSYKVLELFSRATSVEVKSIESAMANLMSEYKSKLGGVIWSTMEKIRTKLLEDGGSSSSLNSQESSDIHNVTLSVMTYIRYLWGNYSSVDAAICDYRSVPHIENVRPLDSMIMEMVSCLQEKLANISESFPDQGLRFLLLLNNSYYIQQIHEPFLHSPQLLCHAVNKYLEVSWAPLLSCLSNATPLCLGKNYSPLSKFDSELEKIYITQKQWKVPDPDLKRRLRKVIIDKIIPGYTEYIEDNNVTNPKFSPQELESMMQELFEG